MGDIETTGYKQRTLVILSGEGEGAHSFRQEYVPPPRWEKFVIKHWTPASGKSKERTFIKIVASADNEV